MDSKEIKEWQEKADQFIEENLAGLCMEVMDWNETGVYKGMFLKELSTYFCFIEEHYRMSIAKKIVGDKAIEFTLRNY